jgi:predicted phosphate transport protein (TIGR00153 family)
MGVFDFFRSRENDFLKALGEQALKTREGLEALEAYMKDGDETQAKRLQELEKEADELRRILIDDLNKTFVTPIDREDLFALSRTIDDVLDYGYTTVDEMVLFGVKPNLYMQRLASILNTFVKSTNFTNGTNTICGNSRNSWTKKWDEVNWRRY